MAGAKQWKQMVQVWKANHVRRTGNVAAHLMARNAKLVSDYVVWVEDTPPIIQSQVIRDVLHLNLSSV